MTTYDDVARTALALPEVEEGERRNGRSWSVGGKTFAWQRPFSKADVKRFGADPVPAGPILAIACEDLGEKEAVLAQGYRGFFDIPHFSGYPAYLVDLAEASEEDLTVALEDAWAGQAPSRLLPGGGVPGPGPAGR